MRITLLALFLCGAAFAAVDGTVVNGTTGKPQAGALLTLYKLGPGGMESPQSVKSDAEGKFTISQAAEGPNLLQTIFDGVVYNQMITPGSPTNNLQLQVFNAAKKMPPGVRVEQHMLFLEPSGQQLAVTENFFFKNDSKFTYSDPENGTLRFHVPSEASQDITVSVQAPGGMPVQRPAQKTSRENVYKLDFAIKPGETRFDLAYVIPFSDPGTFSTKYLFKGESRIAVPPGVIVTGEGLQAVGQEPNTQATIYASSSPDLKLEVQGTGSLRAASQDAGDDAGPSIEQILPRIYDKLEVVLASALTALALGFFLLYRSGAARDVAPQDAKGKRRG